MLIGLCLKLKKIKSALEQGSYSWKSPDSYGTALPGVERVKEGAEGVVAGKQNLVMNDE